ncbi:peptidoglycan-associated lipoprotein [Thiohalospira halophila DSM 15071]|uniref:Peptidoglycan-associated lipoprotein n=1 Tax=Thiohalospira halophila DSM 15071 TaxID=1123397 RepID=A0A1I1QLT5_9GAMM|nr:peptidoglycan-associated lipoprotein Pal [Thiohalospira halophila]SFD23066.1 peptidoglycan-associated lipoprotein [Thiohalospira halophila DSM 15071]
MKIQQKLSLTLLAALLAAGCASTPDGEGEGDGRWADGEQREETAREGEEAEGTTEEGVAASAAAQRFGFAGQEYEEALEEEDSLLHKRTIYFEFDSDSIQAEFEEVLAAHAAFMAEHEEADIILEGHTDARGSREYNLGLGRRRAESVRDFLELEGAPADRIEVVSFGEERPAAHGSDEQAWQQNRRVEILYSGVDR